MARIRLLTTDLTAVAGSATYCEELAWRLASRGHEVSVVCFRATERVKANCQVLETGHSPHRNDRFVWRFAYHLDEAHCSRALRAANFSDVDLAIGLEHMYLRAHKAICPRTPWLYVPLSLIAPIEIRSYPLSPITKFVAARLFLRLQRWAMRESNATVRFTRMSCDALDRFYGGNAARQFLVNPMPIYIPSECPPRRQAGRLRLLTVGRLVESKNVGLALNQLAGLRDLDWQYDIVGSGPELEPLKQRVRSLGLEDRVFCHGRQPETETWYRRADLFLFTSKLDNCPMAVLEAMSYGVPVLGIRPDGVRYQSGIEELVEHQHTGLLSDDECDFQCQLKAVLSDPRLLEPLRGMARQETIDRHSWDAHLDRFEHTLSEIAARGFPAEDNLPSALSAH